MVGLMIVAVVLAVLPLLLILGSIVLRGASSLSVAFFTRMPVPAGETGGGVYNAIVGTLIIVGMAAVVGVPVGMGAGIYCSEYPGTKLALTTRFVADVLNGTPSIVVGIFAWTILVAKQHHFSAIAGSLALATLMIPMVMRTTEELMRLVPNSLREAALALGYARWRTCLSIMVRTALPGIVTGALLSVARIAGETAPLLFTALGSQFLSFNPNAPMAALPLVVYTYGLGPYEEWHQFAWATALILILVVLVLSLCRPVRDTSTLWSGPWPEIIAADADGVDLTALYGETQAVKSVSLAFPPNQVHALIGPSGCGKSTFLRSLNRMHEMSLGGWVTGQVLLDGQDVYGPDVSVTRLRRRVGMVFQMPTPFPTKSIYDNVAAGLVLGGKRPKAELDAIVERSLRRAALWEEVKDRLHTSAIALSGGQQQRLSALPARLHLSRS